MPKDTTRELSLNEPMLAAVPIRTSARTSRFPRHLPVSQWVASSYMPSLSAPVPSQTVDLWSIQTEDVHMAPPPQTDVKLEPVEGFPYVAQAQYPAERHVKVEEVAVSLSPGYQSQGGMETSGGHRGHTVALDSDKPQSSSLAHALGGTGQMLRPKVESALVPVMSAEQLRGPRNVRPGSTGVLNELEERRRLEHAMKTIDALKARIHTLERNEQRLKKQLKEEKERLKNAKVEAEGALNLLVLAEERVCEVEANMAVLRQDVDRYRGWWLTEYYSLRALLAMLPRDKRDDVKHIMDSAHSRFTAFST